MHKGFGQLSKEVQMDNKYMKECSIFLVLRILRNVNQNYPEIPSYPSQNVYHKENNNKCWQGFKENGTHIDC
jgi:hypothetical protein